MASSARRSSISESAGEVGEAGAAAYKLANEQVWRRKSHRTASLEEACSYLECTTALRLQEPKGEKTRLVWRRHTKVTMTCKRKYAEARTYPAHSPAFILERCFLHGRHVKLPCWKQQGNNRTTRQLLFGLVLCLHEHTHTCCKRIWRRHAFELATDLFPRQLQLHILLVV